ncbi:hypothetical protein [Neisseria bacilliformis]|jgi:hypothetical protein|uniref:hypothetical protein n=1 Tax=Neisseria bacilliformis TaxID=267212 RepID=UPI000667FD08|nr:hypothetical protein [Neisseria bacilliformis]
MKDNSLILQQYFNTLPRYQFDELEANLCENGIYVLFEQGEKITDLDRVVCVGTHKGQDRLQKRLKEHFLTPNKDRSIVRKHIGRAILNRDNNIELLTQWDLDLTDKKARDEWQSKIDTTALQAVEEQVSEYIQKSFSFAIIPVETEQERLYWKSRIIPTLACSPHFRPSENWLGRFATHSAIRESGMWLVQNLNGQVLSDDEVESLMAG